MKRLLLVLGLILFGFATPAAAEPTRVATLLPFVDQALKLDPENVVVVATVRSDLHIPVAEGTIDLGSPHSPNFERLAEARPQFVVGDRMIHSMLKDRLAASGAEVILLDTTSVNATLDGIVEVGQKVGASDVLQKAVDGAQKKLGEIKIERPVRVLILFGAPGTFYAVSEQTWMGDLASRVGYKNASPAGGEGRFPGFVPLNDEILATLRPDLVLLIAHGDPKAIQADFNQRASQGGPWASLAEASLGVHALDPAVFSANPGLAMPRAGEELAEYSKK